MLRTGVTWRRTGMEGERLKSSSRSKQQNLAETRESSLLPSPARNFVDIDPALSPANGFLIRKNHSSAREET